MQMMGFRLGIPHEKMYETSGGLSHPKAYSSNTAQFWKLRFFLAFLDDSDRFLGDMVDMHNP